MTDNITLPREVVKEAVEALELEATSPPLETTAAAMAALRAHLAAPKQEPSDLRKAAEAVLKRWDSPAWEWKKQGPTADLMADLRKAVAAPKQEPSDDLKAMNEALRILTKRESGDLRWQVSDACDILRTAVRKPRAAPKQESDDWIWLHKSGCALFIGGYQCNCGLHQQKGKPSLTASPEDKTHPGYVIGSHWLETAYSRVCAGEAEADVLLDYGWRCAEGQRTTQFCAEAEALRREAERYRYLRSRDPAEVFHKSGKAAGVWIDWEDDQSGLQLLTGDDADAAIDAAMKEGKT